MASKENRSRRRRRSFLELMALPFKPLAPVWRLCWKLLNPHRWSRWLSDGFHRFFDFHKPGWMQTAQRAINPPTNVKTPHLFNPFYWLVWGARFALSWILSRPYKSIGPAVPAIAMAIGLGVLIFEVRFQNKGSKLSAYRDVFNNSVRSRDFDTAMVSLASLIDMTPEDLSLRYQRALIEKERGNREEAINQMLRLALGKKYGPAALWLVTTELDLKNMGEWTEEQHKKFRAWTEIALQDTTDKRRLPAKTLMATYLYGIGAYTESLPYFEEIVPQSPEMAYAVAVICKERGDERRSMNFAAQSEEHFSKLLASSPNNVEYRMGLAKALVLQKKEDRAHTILLDGFNLTKSPELRTSAAECLVTLADRLGKSDSSPATLMERLRLSQRALQLAGDSGFVMDSIISLLFQIRNNQNQEVLALRSALVQGLNEDSVHFVRGTVALLNDNFDEAKVHLELASQKDPNMPGVLNNLAVAMSQSKDPDLESALKLSNAALERMPNHPFLRDTRGQILLKLGRYKEAVPDLEAALKAPEIATQVHEALAIAYDALGQAETAADHRRLAGGKLTTPTSTSKD